MSLFKKKQERPPRKHPTREEIISEQQKQMEDSLIDEYKQIVDTRDSEYGIVFIVDCKICGKRCYSLHSLDGSTSSKTKCNQCNIPIIKAMEEKQ